MPAVVLALLTLAGALAGCGSSHSTGTSADPAGAVPASAVLYASATVRPAGSLKTDALAAGHTLSHEADPYLRLVQALQTPGSAPLDYKRDVSPWLGTGAGIFLTSLAGSDQLQGLLTQGLLGGASSSTPWPFGAHGLQGAIVLDTRDAAKAKTFLSAQAARASAHGVTYRGVAYQANANGVALGLVDHLAVIGSDSGLRAVVDTTLGAPALARAQGYAKLLAAAPTNPLAHVYVNPSSGSGGATTSVGKSGAGVAQGLPALLRLLAGGHEANLSLVPTATSLTLDADIVHPGSATSNAGLLGSSASAQALGELPGDSWLALGLGDAGATLPQDVQGLRALGSLGASTSTEAAGPISVNGLLEGFLKPLNALTSSSHAQRDFLGWMGSGGIFASGSGLLELKGGVVINSKNPALSRAAVAKLGDLLRQSGGSVQSVSVPGTDAAVTVRLSGLPVVLYVADGKAANGQSKFVMGLGEASIPAALNPSSALASASSSQSAVSALGEGIRPSILVEFATLLGLLEGAGLSQDPTISKFTPYLHSLTTLAGGGKSLGGGIERLRIALGLQSGEPGG
ncbi:MAG TPA: DUF3352 domain-containing protein [Solirubrobacteraceae bacterium]|jgi:hypothetical protein